MTHETQSAASLDTAMLPSEKKQFVLTRFLSVAFDKLKKKDVTDEDESIPQPLRRHTIGKRLFNSLALAVPLIVTSLGGQELMAIAQRRLGREHVNPTLLEQVAHVTSIRKPVVTVRPDCSATSVPYVLDVQRQIPSQILLQGHESNNAHVQYISLTNTDTKKLFIERDPSGEVMLDMHSMQAYAKAPDSAYFMFQIPGSKPVLVKTDQGKLVLNPTDTDPTHRVIFANGSTMQLGEFSQIVDSSKTSRRLSVEVDAVTMQRRPHGSLAITQIAGKNGDNTPGSTVTVRTSKVITTQMIDALPAACQAATKQPIVAEPLSPIPFGTLGLALDAAGIIITGRKKHKKDDLPQPNGLENALRDIFVAGVVAEVTAQEISSLLKTYGVTKKISAGTIAQLQNPDNITRRVKELIADNRAEKRVQRVIASRGIGSLVHDLRCEEKKQVKARLQGQVINSSRQDTLTKLLTKVVETYYPLQFPKEKQSQLSAHISIYTDYLLDPSDENRQHAEDAYAILVAGYSDSEYIPFEEFHARFLRKRTYISAFGDIVYPGKIFLTAISPQQRKLWKQSFYQEELDKLSVPGSNDRTRRNSTAYAS